MPKESRCLAELTRMSELESAHDSDFRDKRFPEIGAFERSILACGAIPGEHPTVIRKPSVAKREIAGGVNIGDAPGSRHLPNYFWVLLKNVSASSTTSTPCFFARNRDYYPKTSIL